MAVKIGGLSGQWCVQVCSGVWRLLGTVLGIVRIMSWHSAGAGAGVWVSGVRSDFPSFLPSFLP